MPLLSRILLPVDFSERATAAASYARALSERFGAELLLVHVVTPPLDFGAGEISGSMCDELYRNMAERAERELSSFRNAHLPGLPVRAMTLQGEPAAKIVEVAHAEKVDAIIMPTHGFGTFRRFILGSNTAKVLHDADCPVWTGVHLEVPGPARVDFKNVFCGIDLGPQSSKTICWAAMLAREYGAKLSVYHAIAPGPQASDQDRVWQAQARQFAAQELDRLRIFVNAEFEPLIEAGDPAAALCSAARASNADVLVIGRGSAAGVYGRLKTNAYAIIRESPCPVVSV